MREVEQLINKKIKKKSINSFENYDLEKILSEKTGLKVKLKFNERTKKGSVSFFCTNLEQFDYLLEKIKLL